ncbi:LEF-7 [Epinotia aporema granulovirus]|uniref:LEF-7 n=1 Tax=Epinotia aporema granulovirus TaxID=166056 RepID=K4EQ18_9BBAC|nr:LEF-7 [Epinotia aporema granulovirus]AER41462.1 LEF-7 [Epinotia aporema granulovirus]
MDNCPQLPTEMVEEIFKFMDPFTYRAAFAKTNIYRRKFQDKLMERYTVGLAEETTTHIQNEGKITDAFRKKKLWFLSDNCLKSIPMYVYFRYKKSKKRAKLSRYDKMVMEKIFFDDKMLHELELTNYFASRKENYDICEDLLLQRYYPGLKPNQLYLVLMCLTLNEDDSDKILRGFNKKLDWVLGGIMERHYSFNDYIFLKKWDIMYKPKIN